MEGITWAGLSGWYVMPVVACVSLLLIWQLVRTSRRLQRLVHGQHAQRLFAGASSRRRWVKTVLLCGALFLLGLVVMRPQWGQREQQVMQEGRDILLILDISAHALAQDIEPRRLDVARLKMKKLIDNIDSDRVGLLLFATTAFTYCPLTADIGSLHTYLDTLDSQVVGQTTAQFDTALRTAVAAFAGSDAQHHKLAIVVSSGNDSSEQTAAAVHQLRAQNISLLCYGVATPQGAPIPLLDEQGVQVGYAKEESGVVATSPLREQFLRDLSASTGGSFVGLTESDHDVWALIEHIEQIEKAARGDKKVSVKIDRYPWFAAAAWMLLALEFCL